MMWKRARPVMAGSPGFSPDLSAGEPPRGGRPSMRLPGWAPPAFAATTIFHEGLGRLGFETEPGGLRWPKLVGAYQRALLATMHSRGPVGLRADTYHHAERAWITRDALIARYSAPVPPDALTF